MTNNVLGCLGIWETDTDYILDNWDIDLLPELYQQDNIRFEYNQANQNWSKVSCTIFAAVWMLSDLMNYQFKISEIKEIDNLSYNNPKYHIRNRWEWRYVKDAVDLVAKWWNERHTDKVAYYRMSKYSDMVDWAIKLWYTLDTNYCPTVAYAKDYYLDWVLNWYDFWLKTNGHSVCVIYDWVRKIKDNYKGRTNGDWKDVNIYEVKNPISKLTNYSSYLYIYTKVSEDHLEEIKRLNSIKSKCNLIITELWELRHLINDENYKQILHYTANKMRNKIQDCNNELKKYIW